MATNKLAEAARQLTYRAVYLKIYPRPSLAESRQVLRILQTYGEVYMYRNLAYDFPSPAPNTIIAIFKHPESASRLIKASPLKFTLEQPVQPQKDDISTQLPFFQPHNPNAINSSFGDDVMADRKLREFQMSADISTKDHQGYIARQHYYTGFRVKGRSGPEKDVLKTAPLRGLAQFSKFDPEKPQRYVKAERDKIATRKTLRQLRDEESQNASITRTEIHEKDSKISSTEDMHKTELPAANGIHQKPGIE